MAKSMEGATEDGVGEAGPVLRSLSHVPIALKEQRGVPGEATGHCPEHGSVQLAFVPSRPWVACLTGSSREFLGYVWKAAPQAWESGLAWPGLRSSFSPTEL